MTNAAIVARTRVLVVEEDADARVLHESALRRAGYDVATTGTIAEAWRSVHNRRPDLVILGCRLPDGSGIDLLQRWRATALMQTVRAVLIASLKTPTALQDATRAGADAVVLEPCSGETLTRYLGRILQCFGATPRPVRYQMTYQAPISLEPPGAENSETSELHEHEGVFQARCEQCLRGSPPLGRDADEAAGRAVALGWSRRSDGWECPVCIERHKTTSGRQSRKVPKEIILPRPAGATELHSPPHGLRS
jgi:CheY-like chemotaxis protein